MDSILQKNKETIRRKIRSTSRQCILCTGYDLYITINYIGADNTTYSSLPNRKVSSIKKQ